MQILIDISDIDYDDIKEYRTILDECRDDIAKAIVNGKPLPKGHGRIGDLDKLIKAMKERDEDNGGEPLNAVDRGYHLACQHMVKVVEECVIIEADNSEGEE